MSGARLRAIALVPIVAALAAAVALAASGPGDRSHARVPQGRLVFDDEFNGSGLSHRRWSTCYWWGKRGCTIATNDELEWYQPGQVTVAHGTLRLTAARRMVQGSDGRTYPFVSGMISSGPPPGRRTPKFAFRYGRVEARIRVPAGRGLWPTFWLLPANRSDLPEIDVMEMIGQQPDVQHMHLHYRHDGHELAVGRTRRLRPTPGGWHVFGIDWEPGRLTWFVDGRMLYHVTGDAVPRVQMYLLVDLAVGGELPGPPDAATRFPSAMQIGWLRVWQ